MLRLLLICTLLYLAESAVGQLSEKFTIRQYTTENGLPSNGIKGLQWDENTGFLWIGTEAGIVRFNGLSFKNYAGTNNSATTAKRVLFLVRNNSGQIRAADESRNIYAIEKNKLAFMEKGADITDSLHKKLFTIAISDQLYNNYRRPTYFSLPFDRMFPIDDTSAIIYNNGKVFDYTLHSEKKLMLPADMSFAANAFRIGTHTFISDSERHFFELTDDREKFLPVAMVLENGEKFTFHPEGRIFWENGMKAPILINENTAWLLSYNGRDIVASLIVEDIPSDILVRFVQYSEKQKTLFIGTDSRGLIVTQPKTVFPKKNLDDDLNNRSSYYAQVELPGNKVLTNEGHIIGDKNGQPVDVPIKGQFSRSVYWTRDSTLWYFATFSPGIFSLYNYNFKTGLRKSFDKILGLDIVGLAQSGDNIYVTNARGLAKLTGDSLQYLYRTTNLVVYMMEELEPGKLLMASCSGLLQFDIRTNKLDTLYRAEDACVRNFWKYKDYLFFGTYGKGFFIYHNGKVKAMPLDKSDYLLFTHCFVPDSNGFCWISTNRGLFKVSIAEMINAYEKGSTDVYYHYIGKNDGMIMTELNGGCTPCALRMRNGIFSFPTMDGLLQVDPINSVQTLPEGEIYIDEVLVDNQRVNPDSLKFNTLPSTTEEVIIELGYAAWCNKENIYMEYQLDDTTQWKKLNGANPGIIRFNNLLPGKHTLRVRKVKGFGINNYSYLTTTFSIEKRWYKQWWFFSLQAIMIIALFALFYHFRTRRFKKNAERLENLIAEKTMELQKKNEVLEKNDTIKTRLISIISHDIITPLKFLTVAGKNLLEKKGMIPEELQDETIREMTNTSQELQSLSMNILNWIKYQNENRLLVKENVNVAELVNQVINILNSLAKRKNIQLVNAVDTQLSVYQFYEPLKILIYNLVSNSIAFSEKGSITISSQQSEAGAIITVRDEGIGMKEDQIRQIMADQTIITSANVDNKRGHGLGFMIIKDLIKMMGATISIESKPGNGAAISILLPTKTQ